MRKKTAVLLLLLLPFEARAETRKLAGSEIRGLLEDHTLAGTDENGRGWTQVFQKTGATFYSQGSAVSNGFWDVRGDQYCSQWPPNESWSCYDVMLEDATVTFISASGRTYPGKLAP